GCVFDEEIDIEDQVAGVILYANGVLTSYTLCAYAPYEGHTIHLEGTLGRLEYQSVSSTGWLPGTKKSGESPKPTGSSLWFYGPDGTSEKIEIPKVEGGHGGSDPTLRRDLFGEPEPDPLGRQAPLWEGLQAVLVGAACNQSITTGQPVDIQALLEG
ncbi:MAG: gfo/Idh/MocA family oxidoreductase, partial [Planctomycetes bacterium]|nr:gfo/Idh/MocA family oxidoreductase [Planctomycetota bacterium]